MFCSKTSVDSAFETMVVNKINFSNDKPLLEAVLIFSEKYCRWIASYNLRKLIFYLSNIFFYLHIIRTDKICNSRRFFIRRNNFKFPLSVIYKNHFTSIVQHPFMMADGHR